MSTISSPSSTSRAVSTCSTEDVASGMAFLFAKVEPSILGPIGDYNCFLVDYYLQRCLEESKNSGGVTKTVIIYSALIKRIMTIIQDFDFALDITLQHSLVEYIYRVWDFSADIVCHETVDIFSMLLSNHSLGCANCKTRKGCCWSDDLAEQLFYGEAKCRSRFKCLLILLRAYTTTYSCLVSDEFLKYLYNFIDNPTLSVVISDIISYDLMTTTPDHWQTHVDLILSCIFSEQSNAVKAVKDRLIPKLIRSKPLKDDFLPFLMRRMKETPHQPRCLDMLLSLSRLLILSHKKCISYKYWSDYVPLNTMRYAVLHCTVQVRLSAWLLLSEHPQRTLSYSSGDLQLIQAFLTTNMTEQSPAIRMQIIAGLRKILSRIAETSEQALKGKHAEHNGIGAYNSFISAVISLAFDSLSSGANFNRRIMALSMLRCIYVEDVLRPNGKTLLLSQLRLSSTVSLKRFSALVTCLDDPFQLCQISALEILKNLPIDEGFEYDVYKNETLSMMRSISSHNTLAACYRLQFYVTCYPHSVKSLLNYVVDVCQENTDAARKSLINITRKSVHPWMNAIFVILESLSFNHMSSCDLLWWTQFFRDSVIPLCFKVADVVTPVVHSMSPEGYIPEETLMDLASSSSDGSRVQMAAEVSQLLLACCWRAHKHVSAILAWAVVQLCPLSMLTSDIVHLIGSFYWSQLTECKHCGAFETAVEGFSSLCAYLWKSDDASHPKPVNWLRVILDALEGKKDMENLCLTRRSAGVPHLVTTILATEPPSHLDQSLLFALESLLEMRNKSVIHRIHSLNVLKAVFSSAALGERVTCALEWACRVAISGCSAITWPERNAAAQLAAALRGRIFGVNHTSQRDLYVDPKNRQSSYEFFSRFPSLYNYLFEQLSITKDEFSVFPTLIFLTHLFPSNAGAKDKVASNECCGSMRNFPLAPFIPILLRVLLWCRAEKLRRLTVAALIAVASPKDLLFLLDWVASIDLRNVHQNHINAVLLLLSAILDVGERSDLRESIRTVLENMNQSAMWLQWFVSVVSGEMATLQTFAAQAQMVIDPESIAISRMTSKFLHRCFLARDKVYLECDFNKNQFLLLCNVLEVPYKATLNLEELVLTKRPLASGTIRNGVFNEMQLSDSELRMEIYRVLQMLRAPLECFKLIRPYALNDLKAFKTERDAACILDVFYINKSLMEQREVDLVTSISHDIAETCHMSETEAMARRLLAHLSVDSRATSDELKWMESVVVLEDKAPKIIALDVGALRLQRSFDKRVIAILACLLQDDSLEIREKASELLSQAVSRKDVVLNPYVCYRLISKNVIQPISVVSVQNNKSEDVDVLFDASSVNPYAESHVFGDFEEIEAIVTELIV